MTRSEQLLRDARGIGLTFIGETPSEVFALWNEGFLVRDSEQPYTYRTIDGAVAPEPDDDE